MAFKFAFDIQFTSLCVLSTSHIEYTGNKTRITETRDLLSPPEGTTMNFLLSHESQIQHEDCMDRISEKGVKNLQRNSLGEKKWMWCLQKACKAKTSPQANLRQQSNTISYYQSIENLQKADFLETIGNVGNVHSRSFNTTHCTETNSIRPAW